MMDGVTYNWTFGTYSYPVNLLKLREGDFVEFHLKNNPNNKMPHNIDLHAVMGKVVVQLLPCRHKGRKQYSLYRFKQWFIYFTTAQQHQLVYILLMVCMV